SRVDVGRPLATDMPPIVKVFMPSLTVQPLLGAAASLPPPPPPPPEPPPVPPAAPPPPALPPAAPPAAAPPAAIPPEAPPLPAVAPAPIPALAIPPFVPPAVAEPLTPVELPPVATPLPPAPPVGPPPSGIDAPQPTTSKTPKTNAGSHFVRMQSSVETERLGMFLSRSGRKQRALAAAVAIQPPMTNEAGPSLSEPWDYIRRRWSLARM